MSQNHIYIIADLHIGHARVVEFRPFTTVEEHDRTIIERWNSIVKTKDTVYVIGDAVLGGQDNVQILERLNGRKHLILGNHDQYPLHLYTKVFNKIYGVYELKGCILTHIPVHSEQKRRYTHNIHGHLHDTEIPNYFYRCVSAEQVRYTPVRIDDVLDDLYWFYKRRSDLKREQVRRDNKKKQEEL